MWIPTPKQLLLLNSDKKYLDARGDPRSGKSEAFFYKIRALGLLERGIRILVTRDTGTQLSNASFKHFLSIMEPNAIEEGAIRTRPYPLVKLRTGSEIHFAPFDEFDTTKAGSSEYAVIFMEEAHRSSLKQWAYFQRRLSQQWGEAIGPDGRKYRNKINYRGLWTARNSAGHNWAWQIFTRDHPLAEKGEDPKFLSVRFFMTDNIKNLPTDYVQDIEDLPEHMRKQYFGAEEEPEQGLVFPHFKREIHVAPVHLWVPPGHWPVVGGQDHGYKNPTAFNWAAISEDGFVVVFNEYTQSNLTITENAQNILAQEKSLEDKGMGAIQNGYIDPSTHAKTGAGSAGMSAYEQYLREGMNFLTLPPRLHVRDRIDLVARALLPNPNRKVHPITKQVREEGWPRLIFTNDCPNTIREFEEWEWGPQFTTTKDHNESPTEKNDHNIDAVMYILAGSGETMVAPESPQAVQERQSHPGYWVRQCVQKDIDSFKNQKKMAKRSAYQLR